MPPLSPLGASGGDGEGGEGGGGSRRQDEWMAAAVRVLLGEMEHVHSQATEDERAQTRLVAIGSQESERSRRLAELAESNREEEARRSGARAAARDAAEGERRRRMSILAFEFAEERRERRRHQLLAIEAMEAERERRSGMRELMAEMELVHARACAVEREWTRLVAIRSQEAERSRHVAGLAESNREEEAKREAARAAASEAAEGERRRRMSILAFEFAEERRERRRHQRLAIEAMEAERERRVTLLVREDTKAVALERQHRLERQQQAREAVALERSRRVLVLRAVEAEAQSARRQQRLLAVVETEHERQQRMYAVAASQWEMATGHAKPGGSLRHKEGDDDAPHCQVAPSELPAAAEHVAERRRAAELSRARQRQLQWAAFESGVATLLEDTEAAERSHRREWAARAARDEQASCEQTRQLSAEVESWAARTQERLLPLSPHVWRLRAQLATTAQQLWPTAAIAVEVYGSWATGLQLPASDVDLVICGVPPELPAAEAVAMLAAALEAQPRPSWIRSLKPLPNGRVPLIKAVAPLPAALAALTQPTGELALDISLDVAPAHDGVSTTSFTRDVLCASLPTLRPLVLVLKQLLCTAGLTCGYHGGLSSYALVLMATSVLQQPSYLGGASRSVGPLLLRFLASFAQPPGLPDTRLAVLFDGGAGLQTKLVPRSHDGQLLVQDPLDGNNNVGGSCFAFHRVQLVFRDALAKLEAAVRRDLAAADEGLEVGRVLHELLEQPPA